MGTDPEQSTSESSVPARGPGGIRRVPLWVRIVVAGVLVAGIAGVVAILVVQPSAPVDPVDATRSACLSGIREELESRDVEVIEVSFFGIETTGDDAYLARGDAAFRDADGETIRLQVRCTVRFQDGAMRAPSIRFSEPITAG